MQPVEINQLSDQVENLVVKNDFRITKAQKRRDKKCNQEREREKMIEEQEKANLLGVRHIETEKIREYLSSKNLTFYEVPSDGNWSANIFCSRIQYLHLPGISCSFL